MHSVRVVRNLYILLNFGFEQKKRMIQITCTNLSKNNVKQCPPMKFNQLEY